MPQLLDGPVFAIDGAVFHWQDVFEHARASGRWAELQRAAREGLACASHADASPDEESELEALIEAAGDEFRYDRDLLTAQEMEAWLGERGLTARTWLEAVRRRTLRERWADRMPELLAQHSPTDEEVESALFEDLVSADLHTALAERFAEEAASAAAAAGADEGTEPPAGDRLATLRAFAERFRASAVTEEAVRREIAMHQMEWVRIDCRAVEFASVAEAREAALCLREDGLPLEEVAGAAHVDIGKLSFYLDELEDEERSRFLAAHAGHVVGPIPVDDVHILYHVDAKLMPSAGDPGVVDRAADLISARAVAAEVQRRVQWLTDHHAGAS